MKQLVKIAIATVMLCCGVANARVVVDTGASDPYFKVSGKRVATEFEATKAIMANPDATIEKCTPQKGALETADGRPAGAAYKCREVELHVTTKGKPSWKIK